MRASTVENIPMFEVTTGSTAEPTSRTKQQRLLAPCPAHGRVHEGMPTPEEPRLTKLVRSGRHLWWAQHTTKTWDSKTRECFASNQPLCKFPDPAGFLRCPCEAGT